MVTVTCPSCGCELPISKFMPASVCCKKCKATFEVEYDPAELNFWGKAKVKYNNFSIKHPRIIKGLKVFGIGAAVSAFGYFIGKPAIENFASSTKESLPTSEDPLTDCVTPITQIEESSESSNDVFDEPVTHTAEECHLLDKLRSGDLNGKFCEPLLDNGYGSSIQLEVRDGIPVQVKCGPSGKFFNGKENEPWKSVPRVNIKWRTDDQKLFFLQKYGFLSDDEEVRAYSNKYKGKV